MTALNDLNIACIDKHNDDFFYEYVYEDEDEDGALSKFIAQGIAMHDLTTKIVDEYIEHLNQQMILAYELKNRLPL